jgi:hypothetical protein
MLGVLLAIGIQGTLVSGDTQCVNSTDSILNNNASTLSPDTTSVWDENKYFFIALILSVLFLVGYLFLIFGIKEDIG